MFGLDVSAIAFVSVLSFGAVIVGLISGFVIGRMYTLSHEPKRLKNDRDRTLNALLNLMDSTHQLNSDVDSHNTELESAREDLLEFEHDAEKENEFGQLQKRLMDNITKVVESNRRMENDLVVSRYQLEAQAQELDRTRREARTDGLCEVGNRKAFDESFQFMISNLKSNEKPFGLLLVDIDHFKRINDTFGHNSGDEVLVSIGTALKECVRPEDIVCRIGGDEFAILLDGVTPENAKPVGQRISKTIQVYDFSVGNSGESTVVTMSMGLAVACDKDCCDSIYERADKALYKSKAAGRNCLTTIFPDGGFDHKIETTGDQDNKPSYEEFKASFEA